jgi:Concanavalin A-like lectin/glucanases superfamily
VWTMAVYQGRLFAGTLPSGRVCAMEAGQVATWDHAFPTGWRHVAAVRDAGVLRLYVDGVAVAASRASGAPELDVTTGRPLTIGFGASDFFRGRLGDLRLYERPLGAREISVLAAP